jgi:hypothetical protein
MYFHIPHLLLPWMLWQLRYVYWLRVVKLSEGVNEQDSHLWAVYFNHVIVHVLSYFNCNV